ncbi:protein-disulfide reductase DsbD domain-containing protein [Aliiroseovarius sp. 2305UL8-7]|uniref:protein-disulfide reductase DsbD domain-containing protein n=1 Tax=Aliiroseovarius conchicola TaxID=3121637 RepID=UPI003528CC47
MYLIMNWTSTLAAAFLAVTVFCAPASAQSGLPPAIEDIVDIEVLPGWRGSDGQHMAALRIRLADGWKTYWRAPGQSGIPPSLNWSGSDNLKGVKFHWPVPDVFDVGGMQTIGYEQELVLPMTLVPKSSGKPIALSGKVNLGVCKDVCIPADVSISVALPAQGAGSKAPIKRALRQRPDTAKEAGLRGAVCDVEPISDGLRVTVKIDMPKLGPNEVVVVETADPSVWVSQVSTAREGRALTSVTELVPSSGKPFLLNRSDLRLTVLAAGRGVDIRGCTGS